MSEMFEPSPEQFGVFWDFLMQPDVTDVDYNGSALWITDLKKGKYRAKEAEEQVTENFLDTFTHNIANCVDAQFNNANKVLEADTKELRISIIHDSVAATGTSVCIRRSPCLVRNTINGMLNSGFCEDGYELCIWRGTRSRKDGDCKVFYAVYSERKPCDHD